MTNKTATEVSMTTAWAEKLMKTGLQDLMEDKMDNLVNRKHNPDWRHPAVRDKENIFSSVAIRIINPPKF